MKYSCDNHKPVRTSDARQTEIAEIFALRKARAEFGRSARVGACRVNASSSDGRMFEVEAFVGRPSGRSEVTGRNVRFVVHVDGVEGER